MRNAERKSQCSESESNVPVRTLAYIHLCHEISLAHIPRYCRLSTTYGFIISRQGWRLSITDRVLPPYPAQLLQIYIVYLTPRCQTDTDPWEKGWDGDSFGDCRCKIHKFPHITINYLSRAQPHASSYLASQGWMCSA
jgi:hypothetical protein